MRAACMFPDVRLYLNDCVVVGAANNSFEIAPIGARLIHENRFVVTKLGLNIEQ